MMQDASPSTEPKKVAETVKTPTFLEVVTSYMCHDSCFVLPQVVRKDADVQPTEPFPMEPESQPSLAAQEDLNAGVKKHPIEASVVDKVLASTEVRRCILHDFF